MGGDGGVIASNRRYMRGAGSAECTADAASTARDAKDPAVEREEMHRSMKTCAVSNKPLHFQEQQESSSAGGGGVSGTIVACPYGRLYNKEAAVEALLRRKRDKQEKDELGSHVRGLKDLHEVRFHFVKQGDGELIPTCPIRGTELNGQIPAVVLVPGGGADGRQVNVVSERAIQEMGEQAIVEDYGPIQEKIRLAPSAVALVEIKKALSEKRATEEKDKKHKKDKKRKRNGQQNNSSSKEAAKDAAVTAVAEATSH